MFVHKAAVIGGEGGGSYSHAAELEAAGFCLGVGPNCMRVRGRCLTGVLDQCPNAVPDFVKQFLSVRNICEEDICEEDLTGMLMLLAHTHIAVVPAAV